MSRIAIVDNTKLKDIALKIHIKNLCPVNRAGKDCINVMDDGRLTIDESLCTGCGICVKASPEAIKIINLPEELIQIPIHRYGENKFVLYNLPTLLFERVTGILGVNGIGKSTAIKILAGVLNPNLGDYKRKKTDYSDIINLFKGTPTQRFFEDVINGKIRVSYKPQQVDLIPKTIKGRVGELLRKIDERDEVESVVKQLQLKEILKNDITEISGGELQRVAIAGCVLKKANLYIFDEPTSYLDIKQRINISRFIKSLVTAKTAILVVEHDLIILDYIADLINIMYGKEDCYGIVSGVKPVKNGINTYLTGYIREENVRFRDSKIRFEQKPPLKKRNNNEVIISWDDIEKKLGTFMLKSNKGNIYKNEIIGILGENGIGKTTFAKIISGVLSQDKGDIQGRAKISYKPQYLEPADILVRDALSPAFRKDSNIILTPLNIKPLANKLLTELSGGELQRVAIAHCLQQPAELYLLDEPSAYLDVEQRLILSKVIKDFIEQRGSSALIIDHDLLFVDYISDRLIVFEGKPAIEGVMTGPYEMEDGMNRFLRGLNITLRRDHETNRPRVNKYNSQLDREQKAIGKYYYN